MNLQREEKKVATVKKPQAPERKKKPQGDLKVVCYCVSGTTLYCQFTGTSHGLRRFGARQERLKRRGPNCTAVFPAQKKKEKKSRKKKLHPQQ